MRPRLRQGLREEQEAEHEGRDDDQRADAKIGLA